MTKRVGAKKIGRRVEVILLPAPDKSEESPGKGTMIREGLTEEELFLAATFQAAMEDDPEEDAIWRKYIKFIE
ncbi:MAG: hypothetical protein JJE19_06520 [Methanosarcinales archaeon]|nr:hypothetical protein [Methanosarcinales archaeon]